MSKVSSLADYMDCSRRCKPTLLCQPVASICTSASTLSFSLCRGHGRPTHSYSMEKDEVFEKYKKLENNGL